MENQLKQVINNQTEHKQPECSQHGPFCDGACKDPNVDNGMMTKVWGPAGWLFLHSVTFGYPYAINPANPAHSSKKDEYYNFFYYLGNVMPCRYCRESYQQFFKELDLSKFLDTRAKLVEWLYILHNKVNTKLGVPACNIPTFEELVNTYETYRAKCKPTTDEERMENQKKGCVTPADGTPRRSIVKVIPYIKGDITRRDNAVDSFANETSDDYFIISYKWLAILIISVICIMCGLYYFAHDRICKLLKHNR